jgi:hypothetical protein
MPGEDYNEYDNKDDANDDDDDDVVLVAEHMA